MISSGLTVAAAQVFHDAYSIDLDQFDHVRGRLEYARAGELLDNASLAEGCASRCSVCEMLE
jgi:hypothetical protein